MSGYGRGLLVWGLLVTPLLLVACSSGGGGDNGNPGNIDITTINKAVACSPTGDDSTQNIDGSASITRSHTVGSPVFHSVVTRKNSLNQDVTVNYMVHQPMGTPKGIVVLIAGGSLTAYLSGTDGGAATGSGGNFLVRSAHRFMQAGYRVITMDRPNDFADYGSIDSANYLYDAYRTSPSHAVDITTIANRENSENLPVFIAGTSRGAISAVAQNALSMGVAISSPVTRSSAGGAPIGSAALPVSVVDVPIHVLYHENDGCSGTQPANTESLIKQLANANADVSGNYVSGGFVDTVSNNPCGAFDYHGFLGVENCAVNTTTAWLDELLAASAMANPGNARPVAQDQITGAQSGTPKIIYLAATDADDSDLTYALPFAQSALGGSLVINDNMVSYEPPAVGVTTDSFVFTVQDSKGSRSAAVVKIGVSTIISFNHDSVPNQACADCHLNDKFAGHINSTNVCDACHNTSVWLPAIMDHNHAIGTCESCHNGIISTGKGSNHIITTQPCDVCHNTTSWLGTPFDHSIVAGQACATAGCHDGISATSKPATHPLTTNTCDACHTTASWLPLIVPIDHSQVTQPNCISSGCHSEADKSANHVPTTLDCSTCHVTTGWLPASAP